MASKERLGRKSVIKKALDVKDISAIKTALGCDEQKDAVSILAEDGSFLRAQQQLQRELDAMLEQNSEATMAQEKLLQGNQPRSSRNFQPKAEWLGCLHII